MQLPAIDSLFVLSVIAPIIAAGSAVWGLTRELSTKNDDGTKQLTKAGKIAIGLASVSALIGTVSVGFRALQEDQRKAAAEKVQVENKANQDRKDLDERNWKAFNTSQQKALAKLGIDETKRNAILSMIETQRNAGRVITNSDLLAAIEKQRDVQISEGTNRNILSGAPLNALTVRIELGGFTAAEFAKFKERSDWVAGFPERDDEYHALAGAGRRWYDNANYLSVLGLAFNTLLPEASLVEVGLRHDLVMVLDLGSEGMWYLPFGFTDQQKPNGLIFNSDWLYEAQNPNGGLPSDSPIVQNLGGCSFPKVSLNASTRTVIIEIGMGARCITTAIHRANNSTVTAGIASHPHLALIRTKGDDGRLNVANLFEGNQAYSSCLLDQSGARRRYYAKVEVTANRNSKTARQIQLTGGTANEITEQYTTYDEAENYGNCITFTMR